MLARELLSVARTKVAQGETPGILFDFRSVPHEARPFDCYELAKATLYRMELPRKCRVAMLVGPTDDSFGFLETVIRNAGYPWALFREFHAARDDAAA